MKGKTFSAKVQFGFSQFIFSRIWIVYILTFDSALLIDNRNELQNLLPN